MKIIKYDPNSYNTALDELVTALRAGEEINVIPVDPYKEYRKAQDEGNIVQYLNYCNEWKDGRRWTFTEPPERYRIKPDMVKMWQWVIRSNRGFVKLTIGFFPDEESVRKSIDVTSEILQRAYFTEISIEVEQ